MREGLQFYRCVLCCTPVSPWDIKEHHGCSKCGGSKVSPSNLSRWEKIVQVVKHPKVWAWNG